MKKFSALVGISALVLFGFALAPAAHAGNVSLTLSSTGTDMTFTISGTYAAGVPDVTNLAAPNDPYSMSFTLDTLASGNSGFSSSPGNGFQVNADFSFSLNGGGTAVALDPITVFFYNNTGGNVGGLAFCLDSSCDTYWTIAGQVLFSGSVSKPTLGLPGLGNGETMNAYVNPNPTYSGYEVDGMGPFPFVTPTTTPEPASLLLLGTGLFGLGIVLRRRLKLS